MSCDRAGRDATRAWRLPVARPSPRIASSDGEGSRLAGGRWNSPGQLAVYTAESASLAVLELLVHLQDEPLIFDYVIIPCRFPRRLVKNVAMRMLPSTWRESPPVPAVRRIGDEWLARRTSAVLAVPSAVIEGELNYVLNPLHEDFSLVVPRPASAGRGWPKAG